MLLFGCVVFVMVTFRCLCLFCFVLWWICYLRLCVGFDLDLGFVFGCCVGWFGFVCLLFVYVLVVVGVGGWFACCWCLW